MSITTEQTADDRSTSVLRSARSQFPAQFTVLRRHGRMTVDQGAIVLHAIRRMCALILLLPSALAALVMVVAAPHAQAAPPGESLRDGKCQQGEFCYYYNSNNAGSVSDFPASLINLADYGDTQPTCYEFKGVGNGKGSCIKNAAASVWNRTDTSVRVYYNSGYAGAHQDIPPGTKGNLGASLKNENASHRALSGTAMGPSPDSVDRLPACPLRMGYKSEGTGNQVSEVETGHLIVPVDSLKALLFNECEPPAAYFTVSGFQMETLPDGQVVRGRLNDDCSWAPSQAPNGVDFRMACRMHDYGKELIRMGLLPNSADGDVDALFMEALRDHTCTAASGPDRMDCQVTARGYWLVVVAFGAEHGPVTRTA